MNMAYFRCGSDRMGDKPIPLSLSASAVACRMAGNNDSRPWIDCNLSVKLSDMIAMGYKTVEVYIRKGSSFTTDHTIDSFSAFGVNMGFGTKTIQLADCTQDNIGGRVVFNRGYGGQDGFQEIIYVTATFTI